MLKAVIFDLDGTILLNNEAYDVAFGTVLQRLGVDLSHGFHHVGGIGVQSNWRKFIQRYNLDPNLSLNDLERQTQEVYLQNIDKIKVREGFFELVEDIRKVNIKTALATGNDLETTKKILEHFEISKCFDIISTIYEAGKPKPEPDIFLLAVKRLQIQNENCIVIEDSEAGIESARRAEIAVISIHDYNFTDLSLQKLQSLLTNR